MKMNAFMGLVLLSFAVTLAVGGRRKAFAGEPSAADYKVLAPIRHGNPKTGYSLHVAKMTE